VAEKAKILLVDDRPENLVALEAILGSLNQELVTARSGDAALKALLSDEFAVILLDVLMPGMDGFETAAHIKRRPRTRDVPIIFLTALNSEPDSAFRSYSAGAVDYIAKPFDPWVLRAKVSVFVDLYMKNRQLSEQAALLTQPPQPFAEVRLRNEVGVVHVVLPREEGSSVQVKPPAITSIPSEIDWPCHRTADQPGSGLMLWLKRKTLSGSYRYLTRPRRCSRASFQNARTRSPSSSSVSRLR